MSDWYRILVTASRDWDDPLTIYKELSRRHLDHGRITVVHGDCPTGGDKLARNWAVAAIQHCMTSGFAANVRHEAYPAEWNLLGKQAGPIRNRFMVELGADECLAFPLPQSRGTISCMDLATAAGIPITNLGRLS